MLWRVLSAEAGPNRIHWKRTFESCGSWKSPVSVTAALLGGIQRTRHRAGAHRIVHSSYFILKVWKCFFSLTWSERYFQWAQPKGVGFLAALESRFTSVVDQFVPLPSALTGRVFCGSDGRHNPVKCIQKLKWSLCECRAAPILQCTRRTWSYRT